MGANPEVSQLPHSWLVDELDRTMLSRRRALFERHNAQRMVEVTARLPETANHVLNALPLLLHLNHPGLPGYSGYATPHGIAGYRPDWHATRAVRQFSRLLRCRTRSPTR